MGTDQHVSHLIASSHRQTWFTTQGLPHAASFELGVLPGDPYSDMVFNAVMTVALKRIHAQLDAQGLLTDFHMFRKKVVSLWFHCCF